MNSDENDVTEDRLIESHYLESFERHDNGRDIDDSHVIALAETAQAFDITIEAVEAALGRLGYISDN